MFTSAFFKQCHTRCLLFLGVAALLLAACDSGNSTTNSNATPTPAIVTSANALMRHTPAGTLQLSWDHASHTLTVQIALTGLVPKSIHPAHIHTGSCQANNGKVVYALNNVVADAIGFANTITKIKDVTDGIPTSGWYVNVHNGPNMTPAEQAAAITCADVANANASTKTSQIIQATLASTVAPNQAAGGNAQLSVNNQQLTVHLSMQGLAANSTHGVELRTGSCASQGKVVYPLKPLDANGSGSATSTTTIPNVASLPQSGWYIDVHLTTDMAKQTGADTIACGDIVPAQH